MARGIIVFGSPGSGTTTPVSYTHLFRYSTKAFCSSTSSSTIISLVFFSIVSSLRFLFSSLAAPRRAGLQSVCPFSSLPQTGGGSAPILPPVRGIQPVCGVGWAALSAQRRP